MASNLRVDTILPSSGTNVAIGTASGTVSLIGDSNLTTSGNLTIGGNLGVGGTLTYEDVTNIDSVGVITARADINLGDSIIHIGDTNTKIRFPAADTITAETGGSERLRIHSGGQISIGSATEGHADADELTLAGTRTGLTIRSASDNYGNIFFSDATSGADEYVGAVQYYHADNSLIFKTSSTNRLLISSAGYVTKPATPFFSVYGSASNQTYNQNDIITFENAVQNVGNHFKMTSGTGQYQRFIAPVAGVYLFTFAFFPNTASACRIGLRVNTSLQTTPYISGCFTSWGTGSPVPSASQMLLLGANAYVDLVVANGTLTNTYDGHTTFQGILLG